MHRRRRRGDVEPMQLAVDAHPAFVEVGHVGPGDRRAEGGVLDRQPVGGQGRPLLDRAARGLDAVLVADDFSRPFRRDKVPVHQAHRVGFKPGAVADVRRHARREFAAVLRAAGAPHLDLPVFGHHGLRFGNLDLLAALLQNTRLPVQGQPAGALPFRAQLHHHVRPVHHHPGRARMPGLAAVRLLPALPRLRRAPLRPVRRRRLAGVAAGLFHLFLNRLQPPLQAFQQVEQLKNKRVLLRMAHAIQFGLGRALQFHAVSIEENRGPE